MEPKNNTDDFAVPAGYTTECTIEGWQNGVRLFSINTDGDGSELDEERMRQVVNAAATHLQNGNGPIELRNVVTSYRVVLRITLDPEDAE
jgi:hypothetical protein